MRRVPRHIQDDNFLIPANPALMAGIDLHSFIAETIGVVVTVTVHHIIDYEWLGPFAFIQAKTFFWNSGMLFRFACY